MDDWRTSKLPADSREMRIFTSSGTIDSPNALMDRRLNGMNGSFKFISLMLAPWWRSTRSKLRDSQEGRRWDRSAPGKELEVCPNFESEDPAALQPGEALAPEDRHVLRRLTGLSGKIQSREGSPTEIAQIGRCHASAALDLLAVSLDPEDRVQQAAPRVRNWRSQQRYRRDDCSSQSLKLKNVIWTFGLSRMHAGMHMNTPVRQGLLEFHQPALDARRRASGCCGHGG